MPQPPAVPDDAVRSEALALLRQNWGWLVAAAALLVLLYYLGPILTPFAVGAVLAFLGDPVVDRLEKLGLSRTLGVSVVFLVLFGAVLAALLVLVPLLEEQVVVFVHNIPDWLKWLQEVGLPRLHVHLPPGVRLDPEGLRNTLTRNWAEAGSIAGAVLGRLGRSTPVVIGIVADLLLIPIVSFYLLRDWDLLVARVDQLIPLHMRARAESLARETNAVLSALIRGQLLVMAALAAYYSAALSIAGLNVALLIGLLTGLISFIPYLGFATGLLAATVAMVVQTQSAYPLIWIGVIYGIGQILESAVLTPLLVGDRIGLHPVAVIFAILAGGQLFGFVGVLVALPMAAVCAVLLRHALGRWLASPLYLGRTAGESPPAPADAAAPPPPGTA
ncbi:MAG: AI-2E family transporter [Nevskia sp.]|nr:AI-2E family transporter [Nevskia sp.]